MGRILDRAPLNVNATYPRSGARQGLVLQALKHYATLTVAKFLS